MELHTYRNLSVELPAFRQQLQPSGASKSPWSEAAEALLKCAEHHLSKEPEIAWRCYKAAWRAHWHDAGSDELHDHATEILNETKNKLRNWRGDAIREMLADESGKAKKVLDAHTVAHAQRLLDGHNDNLYRRLKALRKRLRVLEIAGIVVVGAWIRLGSLIDPKVASQLSSQIVWQQVAPGWIVCTIALTGLTGAVVSGFTSTKGLSDDRVPLQEAETAIMIGRLVFGMLASLAVMAFVSSGILAVRPATPFETLAVAFVAGFSERLVVTAVNSFDSKQK